MCHQPLALCRIPLIPHTLPTPQQCQGLAVACSKSMWWRAPSLTLSVRLALTWPLAVCHHGANMMCTMTGRILKPEHQLDVKIPLRRWHAMHTVDNVLLCSNLFHARVLRALTAAGRHVDMLSRCTFTDRCCSCFAPCADFGTIQLGATGSMCEVLFDTGKIFASLSTSGHHMLWPTFSSWRLQPILQSMT